MTSAHHASTTAPLAHMDVLVLDYLAALWAETEDLPPDLRDELMTTVADYIAMRRASAVDPLEDAEQIVRRLGPPRDLAAAARRGRLPVHLRAPVSVRPAPVPPPVGAGQGDYAALALLTAGSLALPVISPLAGLIMVSGSARLTPAVKAGAWILCSGAAVTGLLFMLFAVAGQHTGEWLVLAYLVMVAGPFVAALTLIPGVVTRRDGARR